MYTTDIFNVGFLFFIVVLLLAAKTLSILFDFQLLRVYFNRIFVVVLKLENNIYSTWFFSIEKSFVPKEKSGIRVARWSDRKIYRRVENYNKFIKLVKFIKNESLST